MITKRLKITTLVTGGVESLHGVGVPGMSPPTNGIVQYTTSPDSAGTPFFVPSMSAIGSSSGLGSPHDDSSRLIENNHNSLSVLQS